MTMQTFLLKSVKDTSLGAVLLPLHSYPSAYDVT